MSKTTKRIIYIGEHRTEKNVLCSVFLSAGFPEDSTQSLYPVTPIKKGLGHKPVVGMIYEVECTNNGATIQPGTMKPVQMWKDNQDIAQWRMEEEISRSRELAAKKSKLDADLGNLRLVDIRDAYRRNVFQREHFLAKVVAYMCRL